MPSVTPSTSQRNLEERHTTVKSSRYRRIFQIFVFGILIIVVVVAWQSLNAYNNSTDPTIAGRPLSNPHTHLHSVVLGDKPGVLYLGTHYGLFTSTDGGHSWLQSHRALSNYMVTSIAVSPSNPNNLALISAIQGTVLSIIATNSTPRILYCATDQGCYHWQEGTTRITQVTHIPMTSPPIRLVIDKTGKALYGLSGQDLWFSSDEGSSWVHRWHFDRGDLISLVVDLMNPYTLYAGFFLPPEVIDSKDGGSSWQTLTD